MNYCPDCGIDLSGRASMREPGCDKGEKCAGINWENPTPVAAALVEWNEHFILAHNKSWPRDWYGLITGFIEKFETPEETVVREVEEELGLKGEIVEFIGHYSGKPHMNQLLCAYHIRATGPSIVMNEELDDYRMVLPHKLKPWPFGTGHAVRDFLIRHGHMPAD